MEGRFLHLFARYQRYPIEAAFIDTTFLFLVVFTKNHKIPAHAIQRVMTKKKDDGQSHGERTVMDQLVFCIRCFRSIPDGEDDSNT